MKLLAVTALVLSFCACGSLQTVAKSNAEIKRDLTRHETKCSYIPRVYSGVAYDFCRLHGEPNVYGSAPYLRNHLFDMALLSPIMDTILLPVTITQQVMYGGVELDD